MTETLAGVSPSKTKNLLEEPSLVCSSVSRSGTFVWNEFKGPATPATWAAGNR